MNEEKLIRFLQSHVDYPIDEEILQQVKAYGSLDINSENALLILEEIRKQNSISKHLKDQGECFKKDENTFIAKTLAYIEKQEQKTSFFSVFWNAHTLPLALSLCFGLLLFFPFFQNNLHNNSLNKQNINSYMLDSLQPIYYEPETSSTDILQSENFGSDKVALYLTSQTACSNC